jgi:hypothetical protein
MPEYVAVSELAKDPRLVDTRKPFYNVMLGGVQAFLMGLAASGHGDNEGVGRELHRMGDFYLQTGRNDSSPQYNIGSRNVKDDPN